MLDGRDDLGCCRRNKVTTMSTGMTVQASSTGLLPYTCAGSRPSSFCLLLNFTTEYASKAKTTTKITAVIASTKSDSSKIQFADVEAGAKMFVALTHFTPLVLESNQRC